ncbi:hypothetical protein P154DRAFT_610965 [Amniculicola lignicola CBS 123094]|uniref:Uncharacterized protein n=1 Tax=Amniculicola lignicola CBS 123094 TaxID=1392246 RepID=A0A6A5W2N7_9PLEO|nr:hypothetical protein P154DRAFT_610965 [Amniculicola lignicola CBS 123094]
MKLFLALPLLSLAAPVFGLPSSANVDIIEARDEAPEVIRLNVTELQTLSLERRQNSNPATDGTLQAWRWVANCGGGPDFTWFPVSWAPAGRDRREACYEYWDNNQLVDIYSAYLTGSWAPICRLSYYERAGCQTSRGSVQQFTCATRGGSSIKSLRIQCGT